MVIFMQTLPITKLVMDDLCNNKKDVYEVAFYKIENFEIEKQISLNLEQKNCNKIRIIDLNWLKKQDILDLPDVLIIKETIILSKEEQKILEDLNIKTCLIDENILKNNELFKTKINEIERKMYKSRTEKYLQVEQIIINELEEKNINRKKDNAEIINNIIEETLELIKEKDEKTYNHLNNVSNYVDIFIEGLPDNEKLNEDEIAFLKKACLVHDIGKLTIPNQILKKRDILSKNEYHDMKKHVSDEAYLFSSELMNKYKEIALSHHERFDGLGYPEGLQKDEIPYYSRIISVLDAFESMTGNRDYIKEDKKTLFEVLNTLVENAGTQFDPNVVKYFIMGIIKNKSFQLKFKVKVKKI